MQENFDNIAELLHSTLNRIAESQIGSSAYLMRQGASEHSARIRNA